MSLKIRLQRHGSRGAPFYHVVVTDSRNARNGSYLERVGYYNPMPEKSIVELKTAPIEAWLKKGARPSDCVKKLIRIQQKNTQIQGSVHGST